MRKSIKRRKSFRKALRISGAVLFAALLSLFVLDIYLNAGKSTLKADCEYHFISVGQGDCTLIMTEEASIVVDGGPTDNAAHTAQYIKNYVDKIDYMILSHPHEDHVGGSAEILSSIKTENVIMTDLTSAAASFTRLLDALEVSGADVHIAHPGDTYSVGGMDILLLAPLEYSDNMNDNSIVCKVSYKDTSALLAGDAETFSEDLMCAKYISGELSADILKLGHHGSHTSTGAAFLAAVYPKYAIVSCGENNPYGHPHKATLDRIEKFPITVLRTDQLGSIVMRSDGKNLTPVSPGN